MKNKEKPQQNVLELSDEEYEILNKKRKELIDKIEPLQKELDEVNGRLHREIERRMKLTP